MGVVVGIPKEKNDTRVAATPSTVKSLKKLNLDVVVEKGAGENASFSDEMYVEAGATIGDLRKADIILGVNPPDSVDDLKEGSYWVSHLIPQVDDVIIKEMAARNMTVFSMNLIPRITRAQKMDALSSQSNIAGYKAVIVAAEALGKMFPLMMTAAGTIQPAKVVVLGAGVAGLSAVATAKRLGALVEASDVRPAAKEQVESLGAKFIDVEFDKDSETEGGYAKEVSKDFLKRQSEEMAKRIKAADIVITTALVPGKIAPILVTEEMVKSMKPGSVIVDLAAGQGGNCALTEAGTIAIKNNVTIIGETNMPATVSVHASELYAKNILNFVSDLIKEGEIALNKEDEVFKESLVVEKGEIR
ncbi:Re/Si-specific NAD(P)(+) transhydrogenase subunit alpha [Candidatus Woesearchaeota archaeon]|nr:Re/Si-specific NAD(P)(+) transhydrogenase subunit alpha [Candidatus Woesearchaeota archaeon]